MAWGGNDGAVDRWVNQLKNNDPKLVSLHILSFRRICTTDLCRIFKAISVNTTLRDLYISGHTLDATSMDLLAETLTLNNTLRTLNLGNSTFGMDISVFGLFCEGLAENEGLVKLDLENKGLLSHPNQKYEVIRLLSEALAKNKFLQELNLTRNELDNHAVELLAPALTTLLSINLSMNSIGPEGARYISQQTLTPMSRVQELDLSDNPLLCGAAELAKSLHSNQQLRSIKLIDVVTKDIDLSVLPPSGLDLDGKLEDDEELQNKKNHDKTRTLLGNLLAEALGQSLSSNKTLTHVWLDNNGIESSALLYLTKNLAKSSIVELHLRKNLIDDEGALLMAKASSLRDISHLELGENNITAKGFGALLDTRLEYLGLFSNQVSGFGADPSLLPRLLESKICRLDVGCNKIIHQDVEAIVHVLLNKGVPHLKLLEMGGNVEEREIEQWEKTLNHLLEERNGLEIIWKRKPSQMETASSLTV